MPSDEHSENPIQRALDVAAVPWRLPRTQLAARYGVRRHAAYDWEVIEIDTHPPIVEGLLWPLCAQVLPQFSPHLPATRFTGLVRVTEDAVENFRFAVQRLAAGLGPGQTHPSANSIELCWSSGAARLRLVVWPPSMQLWTFTNPAQDRDPRLKSACHLVIDTGLRPPATAAERAWLASCAPVAPIATWRMSAAAQQAPAEEAELEYVREPPAEAARLYGSVGLPADRGALIFYGAQLYLIPREDVVGLHVARSLPAKGPGGARLEVECRTRCTGLESKRLTVAESKGTEDLNALAAQLARETGSSFELGEYGYDA